MLLIALICMYSAAAILALCLCFVRKNKALFSVLQIFSLVSLLCLGFVGANYHNNFSGYSIFIILAIVPQFLLIFDLPEFLKSKLKASNENQSEFESDGKSSKKKKSNQHLFLNSNGSLLKSTALLLSSICLALAGLYVGLETFYGLLIGLAVGLALSFLSFIIKKNQNPYDKLSLFFAFLSIGLVVGQMLTSLLYSFSLTNILYCVGGAVFCIYALLVMFARSKFDHLALFIAIFSLVSTLVI